MMELPSFDKLGAWGIIAAAALYSARTFLRRRERETDAMTRQDRERTRSYQAIVDDALAALERSNQRELILQDRLRIEQEQCQRQINELRHRVAELEARMPPSSSAA